MPPLTAEAVRNKQFTRARFKGYDEKEVDDFLDEVEAELVRLNRENTDLRARLQVSEQSARQAASPPPQAQPQQPPAPPQAQVPPAPPEMPAPGAAQPLVAPPAPGVSAAVGATAGAAGSHEAALRMLAMAQKTADDTVADARRDADKLLSEARAKADQLERETQERHRSVVGSLDAEREKLERKVEELRSFEREYRARLKSYLEGQLRDLEGRGDSGAAPRLAAPGVAHATAVPGGPVAPPAPSGGPAGQTSPPTPGLAPASPPVGGPPAPPVAEPARPASPFAPVSAPPAPGASQPGATSGPAGPSGPPRQAPSGGFEVDEGPEVPPSHG